MGGEENEEGRPRSSGGKRAKRGTPQGGVSSPLLANIYLTPFDRRFLSYCRLTGVAAELRRYADDFVILRRGGVGKTRARGKQRLARMGLKVNEEKSRVGDAREGSFDFLGFTFYRQRSPRTGKVIPLVEPSRESEQYFRDAVRNLTGRWSHGLPQREVVERVNR